MRLQARGHFDCSGIAGRLRCSVPLIVLLFAGAARAQSPPPADDDKTQAARIERLEQLVESVVEENRQLSDRLRSLEPHSDAGSLKASPPLLFETPGTARISLDESAPLPAEPQPVLWPDPAATQDLVFNNPVDAFRVGYDNGFVIAARDPDEDPFSLKINSQNMFRLNEFVPAAAHWIDSAGNRNPISDSNNFQIPRGRLIFSGNVFDPNLSYLLSFDYNTVNSNPIGFRAYELSYQFSRAFAVHVGQNKVPGTREWLESAFAPLEGPDRSMATTFFRPSLSQGIWLTGEPMDGVHYYAMMSNGFNTLNLRPNQLNNHFCWSGSTWYEPWGDFGRGYADLEDHDEPVVRLGASYTFALGNGSQSDSDAVENSAIRLTDGTLITQPGAFAPGVTLTSYDISLAAIDLAFKYQGLSLSTEWHLQDLFGLRGTGPLPISSTVATGGFVQGGCFIIPQKVELYTRASLVTGRYGTGWESSGGFNWFLIPGQSNLRFTCDAAWLENSPASQNRTGYVAGQTGLLIRTQILVSY
ncbi:MAG: hypothetical protein U0992_03130 [Planctomycetaceae bacterium]